MTWTTRYGPVPVFLLLATFAAGPLAGRDKLSVTANAPTIAVAPRTQGRTFLQLPALEYRFEVRTHCAGNRRAESLSLAVADSRASLGADEIASNGPTEMRLTIPARQIAPLAIENFCVLPEERDGDRFDDTPVEIRISAALSAQASLLCAGEEDKAMTYVSAALDVSLQCQEPPEGVTLPQTDR